ncbi:hypothetical protein DYB37_000828 [Aphanomyces astaci]|uniref:YncI copper-binding domain-containing protein n=1 Tax=Aphanomyces astaci TaxID=112090 RepID=A0A3R6YP20_APHAT|nr:hypothetical protein DYB35_001225 [Aphanomyces astaci]RHZ20381.1 hypothetical protein DYB37_000828 [Aphanomyces astaci]
MHLYHAVVALAVFAVSSVSGHATLNPPVGAPNAYLVTSVRIGHSYPGASTKNVTVGIPTGITTVKPKQIDTWKVDFEYAEVNGTKAVTQVTWYGGDLPDDLFQDFGLQLKLADLPNGTVLYFPVTQFTVPNGTLAWTSIPDAAGKLADAAHPAPKLTVIKA